MAEEEVIHRQVQEWLEENRREVMEAFEQENSPIEPASAPVLPTKDLVDPVDLADTVRDFHPQIQPPRSNRFSGSGPSQ